MQSDGDDIRFATEDGSTTINYWIESGINTTSTKIWVKVPSIAANGNTDIWMYYGNPSAPPQTSKSSTFDYFMEVKRLNVPQQSSAGQWFSYSFVNTFSITPVIIAEPDQTYGGGDPLRWRLRNITTTGFDIRQNEPGEDDKHAAEDVTYVAIPPGDWETISGVKISAGTLTTGNWLPGDSDSNTVPVSVSFNYAFSATPSVFSQLQDFAYTSPAQTRQSNVSTTGFRVGPEPQGSVTTAPTTSVSIGWLAVDRFVGKIDETVKAEAGEILVTQDLDWGTSETWATLNFSNSYSQAPNIIAWMHTYGGGDSAGVRGDALTTTSIKLTIEEDKSYDTEGSHNDEYVGYFVIETDGTYYLREYVDPKPTISTIGSEEGRYYLSGNYKSDVVDTGANDTKVHWVSWNPSSQPAGTTLQVSVRASNTSFSANDATPSWTSVSNGGNPSVVGRYIQWMSTFTQHRQEYQG